MRKTMVLLSGGMDSVHTLWRVMTGTDDTVFCHYTRMDQTMLGRSEAWAAAQVAAWFGARFRRCPLEIGLAVKPSIKTRTVSLALFYGAEHAADLGFGAGDRIVSGHNATDDEVSFVHPLYWPPERRAREPRRVQMPMVGYRQRMVDMIFADRSGAPDYGYLEPYPTREQMLRDLPAELLDMTVACGNPKLIDGAWIPCGQDSGYRYYLRDEDRKGQCYKCGTLARWLPRYRRENGWIARGL